MKKFSKIFVVVCVCIIVATGFSGCNFDATVKKASKNLTAYTIDAVFDDDKKTVDATETVVYKNDSDDNLNEVCFQMYGTAFSDDALVKPYTAMNATKCFPNGESFGDIKIESVVIGGEAAETEIVGEDNDILKVELNDELKPKENVEIVIDFILILSNNTHRLGYYKNTVNLGNWFLIACVYEHGQFVMNSYYSTGDPFYSNMANYHVTFSYPEQYTFLSTGYEKTTTNSNGVVTKKIEAKAVRDFGIMLGTTMQSKSKQVGNTVVTYVGFDGDSDLDVNLETCAKALTTFSDKFGEYPYKTLTVAKTNFLFGGMEYPNFVWIASSLNNAEDITKVIVHEIAHQWWYGLVGNNEVSEAWLDEAMAEYSVAIFFDENPEYNMTSERLVMEAGTSYQLYQEVVDSVGGKINTQMTLLTYEYSSEYEYVYMIYVKGMLMLNSLKDEVGEELFFKSIKHYYSKNKFKNVTSKEFVESFNKCSGKDLTLFINSWLNGETLNIE